MALTTAQQALLDRLQAQARAAEKDPITYSRGFVIGTLGCHKTVAAALVRKQLAVRKQGVFGAWIDVL